MTEKLYDRHLKSEIDDALQSARVVNLIGPRQTGKTTLVRDMLNKGYFVSLDDESMLAAVEADPQGQLQSMVSLARGEPIIIDEVQRSKRVVLTIKRIVDENRKMGQFVLTGSSNIFVSADVTDSLTGRVQTLKMLPLSSAEIAGVEPCRLLQWAKEGAEMASLPTCQPTSRAEYVDRIIRGGYPEIRPLPERSRQRRYREYIDAIVDRDVADVMKIRRTDAMRRLVDQLAVRTGHELNINGVGDKIDLIRQTTGQYVDILERLSLVIRLPAWASGEAGRDIRHPKSHVVDTGIATALRGLTATDFDPGKDQTPLGYLVETYVFNELLKCLPLQQDEWRLFHWRDRDGAEVDIIAENGDLLVGFEMKASSTISASDFKNFHTFKTGPAKKWNFVGLVIYLGDKVLTFGDRHFAIPLSMFSSYGRPTEKMASGQLHDA
ncbi:ATP-binding protein [Ensifer adhaerens]|uniref:ATP-binding protein n=1 Tax=Ensifer adhaerens TaxID=106592 RepID=UPI001CBAEA82|nr:ATP-binding protein [Ensifer adhaerens]MBZ7924355.1 ATP-binding protein [Ensifer adhaerens]UAX96396.1 ATP-binding protein [Ensifer adhaerens]UAY04261.1 ATP-binding protein [Ensifer adhaerens]UAY12247.1 ATP-binding protein [Ensifer adhaerens]